jgi:hypothetical protein
MALRCNIINIDIVNVDSFSVRGVGSSSRITLKREEASELGELLPGEAVRSSRGGRGGGGGSRGGGVFACGSKPLLFCYSLLRLREALRDDVTVPPTGGAGLVWGEATHSVPAVAYGVRVVRAFCAGSI